MEQVAATSNSFFVRTVEGGIFSWGGNFAVPVEAREAMERAPGLEALGSTSPGCALLAPLPAGADVVAAAAVTAAAPAVIAAAPAVTDADAAAAPPSPPSPLVDVAHLPPRRHHAAAAADVLLPVCPY